MYPPPPPPIAKSWREHCVYEAALLTKWVWHVSNIDDCNVTTSWYNHSRIIVLKLDYQILCCFNIIVIHQTDSNTLQIPWNTARWEAQYR